jgi:hypothetical protein
MVDAALAALFPLPLTTFEKYMLLDDRPDYPMVFGQQLRVSGVIERSAFQAALQEAISYHPLLRATVPRSGPHSRAWVLTAKHEPWVDWDVLGAPLGRCQSERIDLSKEFGLRVWVRQGGSNAEVTLQFHHACCDGIGSVRFIDTLLAAYGVRTASAGHLPTPFHCNPAGLPCRGHDPASFSTPETRSRSFWAGVRDGYRWLSRRPAILRAGAGVKGNGAPSIPSLGTYCHTFEPEEHRLIRQVARTESVTLNDLLLRDIFLSLRKWNAGQASAAANRWLRIAIPVSLRTDDGACMSAANRVSYNFLTRDSSQCGDEQALLLGIHHENDIATRGRRSLLFLNSFRLLERIPGAVRLYFASNRCFATAVLSNMGDMVRHFPSRFPQQSGKLVVGNLILEEIYGAPPVRPNTRAAFTAGRYGERLWVSVRCDPRIFSDNDARGLLKLYVDRLKTTMNRAA